MAKEDEPFLLQLSAPGRACELRCQRGMEASGGGGAGDGGGGGLAGWRSLPLRLHMGMSQNETTTCQGTADFSSYFHLPGLNL